MSDPLIDPDDLGTYLNDSSINVNRAAMMIAQAQDACERVITPIPDSCLYVLYRVAARAYLTTKSSRTYEMNSEPGYSPAMVTGVMLSENDRQELLSEMESAASGVEAFTIRLEDPMVTQFAPYCSPLGYW